MRRVLLGWGTKGGGRRSTKPSLPWAPAALQPAPATFSSASRLRTLILVVKDPAQSAAFYVDTLGLAVKVQSESMVELTTDGPEHSGAGGIGSSTSSSSSSGPSIVLKQAGYHASVLATGYSPIMTFDVADLDAAVAAALARGGMLDGPIKRPAFGKFASVRSPDGHMLGLFEGGA